MILPENKVSAYGAGGISVKTYLAFKDDIPLTPLVKGEPELTPVKIRLISY